MGAVTCIQVGVVLYELLTGRHYVDMDGLVSAGAGVDRR